jgi:hypothetical protein
MMFIVTEIRPGRERVKEMRAEEFIQDGLKQFLMGFIFCLEFTKTLVKFFLTVTIEPLQ